MSDDGSIDVGRLNIKAQVVLGLIVAIVAWVLSASAAYMAFNLALSKLDNRQERADERFATYKESNDKLVEEQKRELKLVKMDVQELKDRTILLEASEKARNTIK